jgi:hypothetical protein
MRSVYAAVLVAALGGMFDAARLAHSGSPAATRVMASLDHFTDVWVAGLVLFGIHLGLIGWLAWTSGFAPKTVGVLLWFAAFGYIVGDVAKIVSPGFGATLDPVLAVPEAVGEIVLALWLIVRAKRLAP